MAVYTTEDEISSWVAQHSGEYEEVCFAHFSAKHNLSRQTFTDMIGNLIKQGRVERASLKGGMSYLRPTARRVQLETKGIEVDYLPNDAFFTHNGKYMPVHITREKVRMGCTSVTVRALRRVLEIYDKEFDDTREIKL